MNQLFVTHKRQGTVFSISRASRRREAALLLPLRPPVPARPATGGGAGGEANGGRAGAGTPAPAGKRWPGRPLGGEQGLHNAPGRPLFTGS